MQREIKWEVKNIAEDHINEALTEGWEPFAVTGIGFNRIHHLRRQVDSSKE